MAVYCVYRGISSAPDFYEAFATRYINRHHEKTNCDELIGRTVRVTEQVDNYEQTGAAFANRLEWTARSEKDDQKIEAGSLATVTAISGVKLILRPVKEERNHGISYFNCLGDHTWNCDLTDREQYQDCSTGTCVCS